MAFATFISTLIVRCPSGYASIVRLSIFGARRFRDPIVSDRLDRQLPSKGLYGRRNPLEDALPIAAARLPDQPHRRIPRAVLALSHPAPIGRERQRDPNGDPERSGEMSDRRVYG